ncbi:hypothetical protein KFE25_012730 [Diacronema lutheri]|uniref:Mitochondrial carrier protein n=1 Tax=Diacronema lutheri TaxID=2081491 RepID=A0A8J5X7X1_DIALT|nr:hypothetical protein KFE25_012730 [Diacronema lutheri]
MVPVVLTAALFGHGQGGEAEVHAAPSALMRGLVGGAAYGLTVAAVSHPFDTIKARLQAGQPPLFSRSGGAALYAGVGPATVASVLFRTIPFVGYEAVTSTLRARHILDNAPLAVAFLGGAVGGVLRGCAETPAELVKTRQQLGLPWTSTSLLLGLRSTCVRNAWLLGLYWVLFEATRPARAGLPPVVDSFVAGGMCSVGAWALVYPLDTAKLRIQAGKSVHPGGGVGAELAAVYRASGVRGLYRGLGSGLARVLLANGLGMVAYAQVQSALGARGGPAGVGPRAAAPRALGSRAESDPAAAAHLTTRAHWR